MAATLQPPPIDTPQDGPDGLFSTVWQRFFISLRAVADLWKQQPFVTFKASADLTSAQNLGLLATGFLKTTLTGAVATISSIATIPVSGGGTGSTSFTAGSVVFSDGSVLTQNNANLFWDDAAKKFRVGPSQTINRALTVASAQQVPATFVSTGGVNSIVRIYNSADGETGGFELKAAITTGNSTLTAFGNFSVITNGFFSWAAGGSSEKMRITADGRVNIGFQDTDNTTQPIKLYVIGDASAALVAAEREPDTLVVQGTAVVNGERRSVLGLYDTTAFGAGVGPGILFAAKTSASGTGIWDSMGFIQGVKENATDGNTSGALQLGTRAHGGSGVIQVHITSVGRVGIRTKVPGATLHVVTNGNTNNTEHAYFLDPDIATDGFSSYLLVGQAAGTANSFAVGHQFNSTPANAFGWLALYGDSAGTGLVVRKGGNIGASVTAPTAKLHIAAGAAAASSAPLKLTSGTLLTTPEAGAIEFLTDTYYGTNTSGPTRKQFAMIDAASVGAAGEVAKIDSTGLTANVAAATLYTVPASGEGFYRVNAYVVETVAGSVSSVLPNVQILYTDKDSNVAVTIDATPILGAAGLGQTGALNANTGGTVSSGVIVIYVKASTTIQYQTSNYASVAAGMTYALRIRLELL